MKTTDRRRLLVNRKAVALVAAVAFCGAAFVHAGETGLTLGDFSLAIGAPHWTPSIKLDRTCVSDVRDFKPKEGNICLVRVTLTAKKAGELWLTPELFSTFTDIEHARLLRRCSALRVVKPESRDPAPGVFVESVDEGGDRPGRDTKVTAELGQTVAIELAFVGLDPERVENVPIFAALPIGSIPKAKD